VGSPMVPLNRALLSSYRLSIVTIPISGTVWPQFAMLVLTGVPEPQISLSPQCFVTKWHLTPSNCFSMIYEWHKRSVIVRYDRSRFDDRAQREHEETARFYE